MADPGGWSPSATPPPSLPALFLCFLRLGAVSFGGPAMVAYIRRLAVERHRWLSPTEFQAGVALCQALPGATAMQCAAFVGLRSRRHWGAAAAYAGFGLPAFLLMLALAAVYGQAAQLPRATAVLAGLRVLVVALVADAAWTFGRASIRRPLDFLIPAATAAMYLGGLNPIVIVVAAGAAGPFLQRSPAVAWAPDADPGPGGARGGGRSRLAAPALVLAGAAVLIGVLAAADPLLARLGLVMLKVDAFAFGGGFASVPLMYGEVVQARSWLPAETFMDGIALGQVTPGPIVITATFVGHQVAGLPGALVATACIFLPSFFFLLLAEPWFLRGNASAVRRAVTWALALSFVGLLAAVTVQFARAAPWSLPAAAVAALALGALRAKVDVVWVVLAGAAVSAAVL